MRTIALEEHYHLTDLDHRMDPVLVVERGWPSDQNKNPSEKRAQEYLPEIGSKRIALMDEAKIDVQVLSWSGPGAELLRGKAAIDFAEAANRMVAEKNITPSESLRCFCPPSHVGARAAAIELERCVSQYQFKGALINGMTEGLFLDHARFAPILATAERLGVPLYLHPSFPVRAIQDVYYSNLPRGVDTALMSAAFGWHVEVGLHILRMVASGTLEQYPKLNMIIGHMGETLPFMMARADLTMPKEVTKLKRTISETLRSQVYLTTSGFFTLPPLQTALDTFGIDRILFSVDYPYAENSQGRAFLDSIPLRPDDLAKIAGANAARLLRI